MLKKFSTSWRYIPLRYIKNALYRFLSFLIFRIFRQFTQFNFQNCSNNSHNLYLYIVCISEHCIVRPSNYHFWKYFPKRLFAKHLFLVRSYPQEHLYLSTALIICGYYTTKLWIIQQPVDNFLWITFLEFCTTLSHSVSGTGLKFSILWITFLPFSAILARFLLRVRLSLTDTEC